MLDAGCCCAWAHSRASRRAAPQIDLSDRCIRLSGSGETGRSDRLRPARATSRSSRGCEQHQIAPLREGDVILGAAPRGAARLASSCSSASRSPSMASSATPPSAPMSAACSCTFATLDALRDDHAPDLRHESAAGAQQAVRLAGRARARRHDAAGRASPSWRIFPGVKVVAGESTLTSIRQGLAALLDGMLGLDGRSCSSAPR